MTARVLAVLGPTNTGKTHFALERMMAHGTGIMGFPLRLLARENYDRVVKAKGARAVALITGEEKILPPNPRYFLCTVEAMPLERRTEFLAVDEIQLCADPERGHVFTDRLLRARGTAETLFLGAETIRGLLTSLVPEARVMTRPRFSSLTYAGPKRLSRLPPRTAVVAFTAGDVHTLADRLRQHRGGTAVVLGALSPRTRNAQVAMYQGGEVDYLVATDAIGMGLNMDVSHVCFASIRKFDGWRQRLLTESEVAQIAGRAGRHMNDGTFGTTSDVGPLESDLVSRVESHDFPRLRTLYWRNPDLSFDTVAALQRSLRAPPPAAGLTRAPEADDQAALTMLSRDADVQARARGRRAVRLLWDVCGIPDFSRVMTEAHARLLRRVFLELSQPPGRLPQDWIAGRISALDRTDGDIEHLMGRIAGIRTWTYVAHRGDWVADAAYWQERSRAVEDRLSDALHERLTQRFVDHRASALVRRVSRGGALMAHVDAAGVVTVEGHPVGHLRGFRFVADEDNEEGPLALRGVMTAAQQALKGEVNARQRAVQGAPDSAFSLQDDGTLHWQEAPVGRLMAGPEVLRPGVEVLPSELLDREGEERVRERLEDYMAALVQTELAPLMTLLRAPLEGPERGIAFQLGEGLGCVRRRAVDEQIRALEEPRRKALGRHGIRFGVETVYLPVLLKPAAMRLRALLWAAQQGVFPPPDLPPVGRVSEHVREELPQGFYEAVGFRVTGPLALRVDMLERIAFEARRLAREANGPFALTPTLLSLAGATVAQMTGILESLGYRSQPAPEPAPDAETATTAETPSPDTPAPETSSPDTPAPETPSPETPSPETPAPEISDDSGTPPQDPTGGETPAAEEAVATATDATATTDTSAEEPAPDETAAGADTTSDSAPTTAPAEPRLKEPSPLFLPPARRRRRPPQGGRNDGPRGEGGKGGGRGDRRGEGGKSPAESPAPTAATPQGAPPAEAPAAAETPARPSQGPAPDTADETRDKPRRGGGKGRREARPNKGGGGGRRRDENAVNPDSPFANLRALMEEKEKSRNS